MTAMTSPRVALRHRSSRLLWLWCVAYTSVTPREVRSRRRAELQSHLWESEHAGLAPRSVMAAALRGALDDLTWTLGRGALGLARSFLTPTPYVVLAALMPIQAWIVSSFAQSKVAGPYEAAGGFGGPGFLLVAALVWYAGRARQQ